MASFEQRIQFFPPLGQHGGHDSRGGRGRSDERDNHGYDDHGPNGRSGDRDREMDVAALGLNPMNHRSWELTLSASNKNGGGKRHVTCVANLSTLDGETEEFVAQIRQLNQPSTALAEDIFHCEMRGTDHIALYRKNGPMHREYVDTGKIHLKSGKIKFPDHGTWTPIVEPARAQPQPQPQSIPLVPPQSVQQAQPQQVQAGEKCTKCPPQPSLDELMALVSAQCKRIPCTPVACAPCLPLDTQGQDVLIANAVRLATTKANAEAQQTIDAQAKKLKGWMWTALIALLALAFLGIRALLSFYRERKTKTKIDKVKSEKLQSETSQGLQAHEPVLPPLQSHAAIVNARAVHCDRQPLYFVSP